MDRIKRISIPECTADEISDPIDPARNQTQRRTEQESYFYDQEFHSPGKMSRHCLKIVKNSQTNI